MPKVPQELEFLYGLIVTLIVLVILGFTYYLVLPNLPKASAASQANTNFSLERR